MERSSRKRTAVSAFAARPTQSSTSRQSDQDVLALLEDEFVSDEEVYGDSAGSGATDAEEEGEGDASAAERAPVVHPSRRQNVQGTGSPSSQADRAAAFSACSQWRWTTASLHTDIPGHAVVTLQEGESLCLCGYVDVAVVSGAIEVHGFILTAAPELRYRTLYSPRSSSLQCIRAPFPPSPAAVPQSLSCQGQDESITRRLQDLVEEYGLSCSAIVVLREPGAEARAKVNALCRWRHCRSLFSLDKDGDTNAKSTDPCGLSTARLLLSPCQGVRAFSAPTEWVIGAQALVSSPTAPMALVCGGKDVGKSSFSRYLVNALLNRYPQVAHVELDIGQGELSPPGMVALTLCEDPLLGPPPTQQRRPRAQYFVGDTSPKHDPIHYMRCVRELVSGAQQCHAQGIPVVVNTHGWIKGIGLELLHAVVALVQPTHITAFSAPDAPASLSMPQITSRVVESAFERDMWDVLGDWPRQTSYTPVLLELPVTVRPVSHSGFRAADLRQMSLSSYFDPARLTTYEVPLCSVAIHVMNAEVARSQVLYAVNASVVALVVDPSAREWIDENQDETCKSLPRYLSQTPLARCVGLGYIDSIDTEAGVLRLSTPVAADDVSDVSVLLRGAIDIDPEIYPGDGRKAYTMPTTAKHGSGAHARTSRRGLLRRKHQ